MGMPAFSFILQDTGENDDLQHKYQNVGEMFWNVLNIF